MKVLVNGGLNLSELDGWSAEAFEPDLGSALGDGQEHGDDPAWDAIEAESLYDLLEREVIPEFYPRVEHRHTHGLGGEDAGKHGTVNTPLPPTAPCVIIPEQSTFRLLSPTGCGVQTTAQ